MENVNIDIIPFVKPSPVIHLSQNDVGRKIRLYLKENGESYSVSNQDTLTLHVEKPNGGFLTIPLVNGGNYAELTVSEDLTSRAGNAFGKINIESSTFKIGSSGFVISIEQAP